MFEAIKNTAAAIVFGIASVFGFNVGIEEPNYKVIEKLDTSIEVREYNNRIAAETTVLTEDADKARSQGFELIAGYIFGKNKGRQSIAMTSPVEIDSKGKTIAMTSPVQVGVSLGSMTMRFFMPASYSMDTLPQPMDSRVKLIQLPKATQAILRFTGSTSDEAVAQKTQQLLEGLKSSRWKAIGPTSAYLYNPPWTIPFLRTNEVMVGVRRD